MSLISNRYGKQRVRVLRVVKEKPEHHLREVTAGVLFHGSFEKAFSSADNSQIVPTDTVKNTVMALSLQHLTADLETFGLALADHFLKRYAHLSAIEIDLEEKEWERLRINGQPHPHSFVARGRGTPLVQIRANRENTILASGIRDLLILKSTASGFVGYPKCEFTTLPETEDRIFSTSIVALWEYAAMPASYTQVNQAVLDAFFHVFATEYSPSVQRTLWQMGEAALAGAPEISQIEIKMPNKHYLPVNLAPFGMTNDGQVFLPTDEPHGQIEAVIRRG